MLYRSKRTIQCSAPPTSLSAANGVIVVGESNGSIQLFDARLKGGKEGCLQTFSDHKGSVTDLYVVREHMIDNSQHYKREPRPYMRTRSIWSGAASTLHV